MPGAREPVRFGVVGTGFRARAFVDLAARLPDRLRVTGVLTRGAARAAEVQEQWGVPAARSVSDLLRVERPEFVATALAWEANPPAVQELVELGLPVLSETPPAPDVSGLRDLWARVGASGSVQVGEQYALQPMNAARLAVVRAGVIGTVTSAQVSMTQLYHAVSLLRAALGVGFEPAEVRATAFSSPLADPLSRSGWSRDAAPRDLPTTLATIDFGGAVGLYDFTETQTRNPLRRSRVVVRGSSGELVDERVVHLVAPATVVESCLARRQTGQHHDVEVPDLDHISLDGEIVYRNGYHGARLSDEEVAVASLLEATGAWCRDEGPPPYPLAAASQDHLISLAISRSAASGEPVRTGLEPWAG